MLKTVGRSYPWASPDKLDEMYCDDLDHHGLEYWYKDVEEQNKQAQAQIPNK